MKVLDFQDPVIPVYFPLQNPESDSEVKPNIVTMTTAIIYVKGLGTRRFERFSSLERLVEAISTLRQVAVSFHQKLLCTSWHLCDQFKSVDTKQVVERFILKEVQQ